jgi:hypothetical protein
MRTMCGSSTRANPASHLARPVEGRALPVLFLLVPNASPARGDLHLATEPPFAIALPLSLASLNKIKRR